MEKHIELIKVINHLGFRAMFESHKEDMRFFILKSDGEQIVSYPKMMFFTSERLMPILRMEIEFEAKKQALEDLKKV